MSSGVITFAAITRASGIIAPAVVIVATGSVTVVAAAAAAMIIAKAAAVATEAGADALIRLDEAMKRQSDEYVSAEERAEDWRAAAGAVGSRNAAIRSLARTAARVGTDTPLPPPLDLSGRSLCQIRDWCHEVDHRLKEVRAFVERAVVAATTERMRAQVPVLSPKAEELAAVYASTVGVGGTKPASRHNDLSSVEIAVADVLTELPQELDPDTYQSIMVRAARASGTASIAQARTHLAQLRVMVDDAKAKAGSREGDRRFASRMLDLFGNEVIRDTLTAADYRIIDALGLVAGGGELTEEIRESSERLFDAACATAQQVFLLERTTELLANFGYEVTVEQAMSADQDRVRLTGGALGDASATLFVSHNEVGYQMLADGVYVDDELIAREHERCQGLGEDMRRVEQAIRKYGIPVSGLMSDRPEAIQRLSDDIIVVPANRDEQPPIEQEMEQ